MATARVSIGDPQKIGDSAINAYMSYKVSTELSTKIQGLDAVSYTVIRRFSDFFWLRTQLREAHPFLIIPALPEKQQMGRFNQEFVDVRMRALLRWVERIGANAKLVDTTAFKHFASLPAEPFAALRDGSRNQLVKGVAEKGKRSVMKAVKSAVVMAKSAIAQARGTGAAPATFNATANRTAEDGAFRDVELYLLGQAPLMTGLYNSCAASAVRAREQAQLLLDFGAALRSLGQTEGGPLGSSFDQVGLASWAASTAAYEAAVSETEAVVEKLADYVRGTRSVKETLDARSLASAERAEALAEVERLTNLISSCNANPSPQGMKDRAVAETDLVEAKKLAIDARIVYDAAAEAVLAEVDKQREAMLIDFRAMLLDFVTVHVRTELRLAAAWEKVSTETKANVTAEGGAPEAWTTGPAAHAGEDSHAFST